MYVCVCVYECVHTYVYVTVVALVYSGDETVKCVLQ